MSHKPTNMLVDLSNVVHVTRHGRTMKPIKPNDPYFIPLLFKESILMMDRLAKRLPVDGMMIAVDSNNVWRKELLPSYKGNRTKELRDDAFEETVKTIRLLTQFFEQCTGIPVIQVPRAEADDIIAVATQELTAKSVIVSSDRDFVQLVNPNTVVYSPPQKTFRETDDPKYDLFEKCIRGDSSDNIPSAYPKVRKKKLQAAWTDPASMMNLMETVTQDGRVVKELFALNKQLMDLTAQPENLRQRIVAELKKVDVAQPFSRTKLLTFCGQHGLASVAQWLEQRERLFALGFKQ